MQKSIQSFHTYIMMLYVPCIGMQKSKSVLPYMLFILITVNQLRASIKILEHSNDLDLIVVRVLQLGPVPTLTLPDELSALDVSAYLSLAKLSQLVKERDVVKATTEDQQKAITAIVGLLIGELSVLPYSLFKKHTPLFLHCCNY